MLIFSSGFLIGIPTGSSPGTACWSPATLSLSGWWWSRRWPDLLSAKANPSGQKAVLTLLLGSTLHFPKACPLPFGLFRGKGFRVLMPHDFEHCKENQHQDLCHYHLTLHMSPPNPKNSWKPLLEERVYHHFISVWIVGFLQFLNDSLSELPLSFYWYFHLTAHPSPTLSSIFWTCHFILPLCFKGHRDTPLFHQTSPKLHQPTQIHLFSKTLLKLYGECTTTLNLIRVSVLSCFICRLICRRVAYSKKKRDHLPSSTSLNSWLLRHMVDSSFSKAMQWRGP